MLKNKTLCIYKDFHINGSFLTIFDICNFFELPLLILDSSPPFRNFSFQKFYELINRRISCFDIYIKNVNFRPSIVITNFATLIHYIKFPVLQTIFRNASKIAIIDSFELSYKLFQNLGKLCSKSEIHYSLVKQFCLSKIFSKNKEIVFIVPKFLENYVREYIKNSGFENSINVVIEPRKIFFESIIKLKKINGIFYIEDSDTNILELKIRKKFPTAVRITRFSRSIFQMSEMIYYKRSKTFFFEQFGRLLFERYFLGLSTILLDRKYCFDYPDGLFYHLNVCLAKIDSRNKINYLDLNPITLTKDFKEFLL